MWSLTSSSDFKPVYCRNSLRVDAGSCSRVDRYHATVLCAVAMVLGWSSPLECPICTRIV